MCKIDNNNNDEGKHTRSLQNNTQHGHMSVTILRTSNLKEDCVANQVNNNLEKEKCGKPS